MRSRLKRGRRSSIDGGGYHVFTNVQKYFISSDLFTIVYESI